MKNFEEMSLDELKDYAKKLGLVIGNTGKDKLIAKIKEKENNSVETSTESAISSLLNEEDEDLKETEEKTITIDDIQPKGNLLDIISSTIDDLEDSEMDMVEEIVDLPNDTQIPVKSMTFGGLTYKSLQTGANFRWNQIGAIQYMTVLELSEMNNNKPIFLSKPLVILMDERAIKKFRLTSIYENVAKINNLTQIFKLDLPSIEKIIDDAIAVNMRDVIISKVRQMYNNNKLTDINILRMLEKKLSFDLLTD